MPEHMIVPVEWKAVSGGPGELEGYASVFGNVDQDGDVVLPGAFKKTLSDWSRSKQPLPLIADHDLSTAGVIGSVHDAREDGTGLRVKARFSSDQKAQSVRTKMVEGHLKGMSFTYQAVKHFLGQYSGKSARFLQELKLFEVTVSPFPINELATASAKAALPTASVNDLPDSAFAYIEPGGAKDAEGKTTPRSLRHFPVHDRAHAENALARLSSSPFAAQAKPKVMAAARRFGIQVSEAASMDFTLWAGNMRKALDIDNEPASKAAVAVLLPQYHDDAAALSDEQGTADAAADTPADGADGTAAQDPSAYAVGFLTPPGPRDGAPDGDPVAYPHQLLESLKDEAAFDALEAQINQALGRAAT